MECLQYLVSNAVCDACCVCDDWFVAPLSTLVPCPSSRTTLLPYMVVVRMKLSLHLLWPLNALVVHPLREKVVNGGGVFPNLCMMMLATRIRTSFIHPGVPTHAWASCLDNVNALVSLSQFPFPVSHHTVSWPCEFVNLINVLCCGVLC